MIHLEDAKKYKEQIKQLYRTAFPKEERAPLFTLYHKVKKEQYNFYAIVEDEEFTGLIYTMEDCGIVYVFFFAIQDEKRGQGYGSKVLAMIKDTGMPGMVQSMKSQRVGHDLVTEPQQPTK